MLEQEYFQWRLFYPLISKDSSHVQVTKDLSIMPFTLTTKLNMLSIATEQHSYQTSYVDVYYPLENTDVCLKVHDIENLNNMKIEIEIRNRHVEYQSSLIQHWSIYELRYPCLNLPDRILNRLDQITIEKIKKYLQIINQVENLLNSFDLYFIKIHQNKTIWHMNDTDRLIEECNFDLILNNVLLKNEDMSIYIPEHWRTISIQASDHDKLIKVLITLHIENDKDLLEYFSHLISKIRFNSFSTQHQQQLCSTLSPEKTYINLLTMSYASFIELIQNICVNHTHI